MFQIGPNYVKLQTALQLAKNRLKILQSKKVELTEKLKREVLNYLKNGKYMQARIKSQKIIRDETSVETMELMEMFCDQLLERYELFQQMREPDTSLLIPISSLIWIAPYYQTDVGEMKVILKQLNAKYGNRFCRTALTNKNGNVCPELIERVRMFGSTDEKIENFLKKICKKYGIVYQDNEEKYCKDKNLENEREQGESPEKLNDAIKRETQYEFQAKGMNKIDSTVSCKKTFTKAMMKFKNRKVSKESEHEIGKNIICKDPISNNILETPTCNMMQESYQPNKCTLSSPKITLSSRERSSESVNKFENSLDNENFKTEQPGKQGFHTTKNDEFNLEQTFTFPTNSRMFINSLNLLYEDPPPPYSSDLNHETDSDHETLDYFKTYQLPTCPTEDPDSESSSENMSAKSKDSYY